MVQSTSVTQEWGSLMEKEQSIMKMEINTQAIFLKASTTKLPWLPGDYDWVDPNTGRYKFDMGPYDEQKGFDSYVQG